MLILSCGKLTDNFVIAATFLTLFPLYFSGPAILFSILKSASNFLYSVIFTFLLSKQEAYSEAKETPPILIGLDLIT